MGKCKDNYIIESLKKKKVGIKMEKIIKLIEIKETLPSFRYTGQEEIVFIPQEEKEKTTLEYAFSKYIGYELYSEYGQNRYVKFVSKTGKVCTLKSEATIQKKFISSIEAFLHFEDEDVYLFETEEQLCQFIKKHPYSKFIGYMPFSPATIQKEKELKILETEKEIKRLEYLLTVKKELLQALKGE